MLAKAWTTNPSACRIRAKFVVEHPFEHKNFFAAWGDMGLFDTIDEVQDQATRWMWNYNHERPNMALGYITPNQRLAMAA